MRGPRTYQSTCATCRSACRPLYAGRTWLQKAKVCAGWCNALGNFLCREPISALSLLRGAIQKSGKAARPGRRSRDSRDARRKGGPRTLKKNTGKIHGEPPAAGRLLRRSCTASLRGEPPRAQPDMSCECGSACVHASRCMHDVIHGQPTRPRPHPGMVPRREHGSGRACLVSLLLLCSPTPASTSLGPPAVPAGEGGGMAFGMGPCAFATCKVPASQHRALLAMGTCVRGGRKPACSSQGHRRCADSKTDRATAKETEGACSGHGRHYWSGPAGIGAR